MQFFKNLMTVKTVWVDKGGGRWARQRRLHPLLSVIFWIGVLTVVTLSGAKLFFSDSKNKNVANEPEPVPAQVMPQDVIAQTPEPEIPEPDGAVKVTVLPPGLELEPDNIISDDSDSEIEFFESSDSNPSNQTEQPAVTPVKTAKPPVAPTPSPTVKPALPSSELKNYWVRITKSNYTLTLYKGDEIMMEFPIAVGENPGDKQYVGDHRTPEGDFRVVSIENSSSWSHDFGDGKGRIAGAYGPWFIRLSAKGWKGIGIHGTHDPNSLGTMASEGCIRMHNDQLLELRRYAYRNMRVVVEP